MKIILFYPPVGNITQPFLSLPTLTAYLKQHGIMDIYQYDLNLEAAYELLNPQRVMRAYRWCFHYINKLSNNINPSWEERKKIEFINNALSAGSSFIEELEVAKSTFKGENFYNPTDYSKSYHILLSSYLILSARYFPTIFSHQSFSMRYRCDNSLDILAAVMDEKENPFIEIFSKKITGMFDKVGIPDIVGISIGYYDQFLLGLTLSKVIKEFAPKVHITLGGTMMSALYKKDLNPVFFDFFDSIILFEGEIPFLKLIDSIKKKEDLGNVPNLIFRQNGNLVNTPILPPIKDVNSLPTPDFDFYSNNNYFIPEQILPLTASRGCYWRKCAFCTRQHFQHSFRKRDTKLVIEDIIKLKRKYGARNFFFVDECILPEVLNELADEIFANKLDIRWGCYLRFEEAFLNKDFCKKLAQSGLRMIYFGLESACQRILDLMRKGTKKEVVKRVLENTSNAGIMNMLLYFIGFPTESRKEALESMEFILENYKHIKFSLAGHFILEENAPVFKTPEKFGITEISPLSTSSDIGIIYNYKTKSGMSMEEVIQMKNYINYKTEHLHSLICLNRSHFLLQDGQSLIKDKMPVGFFNEFIESNRYWQESSSYKNL